MKTYNITIRASITKTITIEADSEEKAEELAHEQFSVLHDGRDENYQQDTIDIN